MIYICVPSSIGLLMTYSEVVFFHVLTSFSCYDSFPFCLAYMMYVYEPEECGLVFPHYFVVEKKKGGRRTEDDEDEDDEKFFLFVNDID